jgi:hypothetical protein
LCPILLAAGVITYLQFSLQQSASSGVLIVERPDDLELAREFVSTADTPVGLPWTPASKVLVLQVDNRALSDNFTEALYPSLSAASNLRYCKAFGFDYRYVTIYNDDYGKLEAHPWPSSFSESDLKHAKACYHPILGAARAASWCKLLAVWIAAHEESYEYIVYLDSDALFYDDIDLYSFIKKASPLGAVPYNHRDLRTATLLFQSNMPHILYPCAGVFFVRPSAAARHFLRLWCVELCFL